MPPLISIVLPTFNGERYLSSSVESCLLQTHKNIELIIVNDCSTDSTLQIAERYQRTDSRIKIINSDQKLLLPGALNKGFSIAAGEYYTWTSDDNLYAPQALETLLKSLKANPSKSIAYSSYQFINEKGAQIGTYGGPPEELLFSCIIGACFLYKKKVHEALAGYDEKKFRMEDMDFWLRAASIFQFHHIDNIHLYSYRKHRKSLSSSTFEDPDTYSDYRRNYISSFAAFFRNAGLELSKTEEEAHADMFFSFLPEGNRLTRSSERVVNYLRLAEKLESGNWENVYFNRYATNKIIRLRAEHIIQQTFDNLTFENTMLKGQNPKLVRFRDRDISWYYKEYEVLPGWYKKVGHFLKLIQGNRSLK